MSFDASSNNEHCAILIENDGFCLLPRNVTRMNPEVSQCWNE